MNAIYTRQSVDRADSISIESQIEFCKYEMRGEAYKVYTDRGYSGKNTDRPAFAEMMNARALELGATNTNFVNPHGLSHENHYTTAYDLYLIFQQAVQYDLFLEIINTTSYTVNYTTAEGEATSRTISTTNRYLTGDYDFPNQIAIVGGKTGSTMAAGKCIILYANDSAGNPYICVVMGANDEVALYGTMTALCEEAIK